MSIRKNTLVDRQNRLLEHAQLLIRLVRGGHPARPRGELVGEILGWPPPRRTRAPSSGADRHRRSNQIAATRQLLDYARLGAARCARSASRSAEARVYGAGIDGAATSTTGVT